MVRKYFGGSNLKYYTPDHELEGHIFSFGRVGAGKSVSTKSIIEGYRDNKGYKIFDIFGGERNEGLYWAIPSQDEESWGKFSSMGALDEAGPKQYKVNLLYPYFESKLPKKLPVKSAHVNSKLFTIPIKEVTADDIRMVVGNMAEGSKFIWEEILKQLKKNDGGGCLENLAAKGKGANSKIYKGFISGIAREKFLMHKDADSNLDLVAEAKDKEVITVLCLDFVPEKYHLFVINFMIKKLVELIDLNRIPKRNILFLREAATFFRATEDSVLEDKFKIFRTYMAHYIRMGRRGTYFALDCQSPAEVRGLVQGSEDYLLMFKTTAWRDKEEMCAVLKRERRMRDDQINGLAFLEKGECYIAETGKVVKKVKVSVPRSDFWKKEDGNFYRNLWERHGGTWHNTTEVKDKINEKFLEDIEKYKKPEKKEIALKEALEEEEPKPVPVAQPKIQKRVYLTPDELAAKLSGEPIAA